MAGVAGAGAAAEMVSDAVEIEFCFRTGIAKANFPIFGEEVKGLAIQNLEVETFFIAIVFVERFAVFVDVLADANASVT